MIAISDTSAITNLAAIDLLNLLHLLYGQVIIPEAVYRELVDIDPPVLGGIEIQTATWLEVKLIANRKVVERLQREKPKPCKRSGKLPPLEPNPTPVIKPKTW